MGPRTAQCNRIPVCPLRYIAAGRRIPSEARKVPVRGFLQTANTKLEFLVETLAS